MNRLNKFNFNLSDLFFVLVLIAVSLVLLNILKFFAIDVLLALIFTRYFYAIYNYLLHKKIKNNLAALFTMLFALVVIIIPLIVISWLFIDSTSKAVDYFLLNYKQMINMGTSFFEQQPWLAKLINQADLNDQLAKNLPTLSQNILKILQNSLVVSSKALFHIFIVIVLFYYFLSDGKKIRKIINYFFPLKNKDKKNLWQELKKTTDSTFSSIFITGILDSFVCLIMFSLLGVPSAIMWSVLSFFLSILPLIGSLALYIPIGIFYILAHQLAIGLTIIIVGIVSTNITQNLLRAKILGGNTGLHPGLVLLATLGGIMLFGSMGFLLGPIFVALFIELWRQYQIKFKYLIYHWNHDK